MKSIKIPVGFIVIACCTYKRPTELKCLLKTLAEIAPPPEIPIMLLIIDNDKDRSAQVVAEEFKDRLKIHYVVEENKGLANVRNKAVTTAIELNASHIVFIDDDETADINWLINHVDFYNKFDNVYISNGPVYPKFDQNTPKYITNNKIFKAYSNKKLGKIKCTCGCGNVFIPLNILKENNIYFSEEFNTSGGEDTDFFTRLSMEGYNIGWNYNAIVYEKINTNRTNLKWILKRAYNNGIIAGYLKIKNNKKLIKQILYILNKSLKTLLYTIISIFTIFFSYTFFVNKLTDISANLGNITGALKLKLSNYYGENNG